MEPAGDKDDLFGRGKATRMLARSFSLPKGFGRVAPHVGVAAVTQCAVVRVLNSTLVRRVQRGAQFHAHGRP